MQALNGAYFLHNEALNELIGPKPRPVRMPALPSLVSKPRSSFRKPSTVDHVHQAQGATAGYLDGGGYLQGTRRECSSAAALFDHVRHGTHFGSGIQRVVSEILGYLSCRTDKQVMTHLWLAEITADNPGRLLLRVQIE